MSPRERTLSRRAGLSLRDGTNSITLVVALVAVVLGAVLVCASSTHDSPQTRTCGTAGVESLAQDFTPPVADAGGDFTAYVGNLTTLDGSGSSDDTGIASYVWTIDDGIPTTLTGEMVTYVFLVPRLYLVTLNVTDLEGNWDTDTISVTALMDTTPPVVRPGGYKPVYVSTEVVLNGSRSYDPETGIVNYTWSFVYRGEDVVMYGREVRFVFDDEGSYIITLNVTNGAGLSATADITLSVEAPMTWLEKHWIPVLIAGLAGGITCVVVLVRWRKNGTVLTKTERDRLALRYKDTMKIWKLFKGNRIGLAGFIILTGFFTMAVFAPLLATVENPNIAENREETRVGEWDNPVPPTLVPSPFTGYVHPFGTDHIGQDVYSMTLYGARASLLVGFVATLISILVGVTVGLLAGYYGKGIDEVLMRFTDYFLVLPWFPLMIVLMTILGRDFINVIIVIGITSWPSTARIVRSQVLTVKERAFIERARAIGADDFHIMRKHVFPNVLPLVFANTVLLISLAIFSEAFISFFGLGDPFVISWGTMLEAAYNYGAFDSNSWWWVLPPSFAIILCVLAFSLVGYTLDDIYNPKLRKR